MKALVGTFNQEKALVRVFSVIVKSSRTFVSSSSDKTFADVKLFVFCSQEYSSATANMFTAVLCAGLFPDKFRITWFIVLAMTLLFTGIFFYERKSLKLKSSKESLSKCDSSQLLVEQKTESSSQQ